MTMLRLIALDAEFVGIGALSHVNAPARISLVDANGDVLLDQLVNPATEDWPITDYRTWISGIKPGDLDDAPKPAAVVPNVERLLEGNILIGHGLHSDLEALGISHPTESIRDSLTYPPFQKLAKRAYPSLKTLARVILGLTTFQVGAHSSVEDAQASMRIYLAHAEEWEAHVRDHGVALRSLPHYSRPQAKYLHDREATRAA